MALVGRPNVGKSSLLNKIAGSERVVVDEVAGTTRDPVDELIELRGIPYWFVDTAGIRRRVHQTKGADFYASLRTAAAIDKAEIGVVLVDASNPLTEQDIRVIQQVVDAGRALVIAYNKWDLMDEDRRPFLEREIEQELVQIAVGAAGQPVGTHRLAQRAPGPGDRARRWRPGTGASRQASSTRSSASSWPRTRTRCAVASSRASCSRRRPRRVRRGSSSSPPVSSRPATAGSSSAACARRSASRARPSRSRSGCGRSAAAEVAAVRSTQRLGSNSRDFRARSLGRGGLGLVAGLPMPTRSASRYLRVVLPASIPSPDPVWSQFNLGPLTIHTYALCLLAGIAAAAYITDRRLRARGAAPGLAVDIAMWAVPIGIVGARIYHVLTHLGDFTGPEVDPWAWVRIWEGGNALFGSLLGGAVGAWIGCRLTGLRFWSFADALAPGLLVAQAIGRLGNYVNQELFGLPTTLPWGLEIRSDAPMFPVGTPEGTLFHPLFLYEMIWNLIGVALLLAMRRRGRRAARGRTVRFRPRPTEGGGAVHLHHRPALAVLWPVDRAGDQLLAGAGLAEQENLELGRRDLSDLGQHVAHGVALPDDLVARVDDADLLAEALALRLQPVAELRQLADRAWPA